MVKATGTEGLEDLFYTANSLSCGVFGGWVKDHILLSMHIAAFVQYTILLGCLYSIDTFVML